MQYSRQQLDNVNKMISDIGGKKLRTADGIAIQQAQLEQLAQMKEKLTRNLQDIEKRAPYIEVKHVVKKIF